MLRPRLKEVTHSQGRTTSPQAHFTNVMYHCYKHLNHDECKQSSGQTKPNYATTSIILNVSLGLDET